jgi:hypothetical protein
MDDSHPLSLGPPATVSVARAAPLLAAAAASLAVAVRALKVASGGDESIVQAIPDDAFYYIVLAKHFAASLSWTFDGVRPTSGFHLVWAYLLAAFYRVWPEATLQQVFAFAAGAGCVCHAAAAYMLTCALGRSAAAATATVLVFCAGSVPATAVFCMESPWLTLTAAATCAALVSERTPGLGLLALGVAGCLCRTDFIILPAAFALTQWRRGLRAPALWCLLGAAVGVLVVAAHSFAISGAFVQASAATKARWSQLVGPDVRPPLYALGLVLDTRLGPQSNLIGQLVVFVAVVRGRNPAGLIALLGYAAAYTFSAAAVQPWYASSFAIPVLLVVWSALASVRVSSPWLLAAAVALTGAAALLRDDHAWWPNQRGPMLAGRILARGQQPGWTGAWNAGVLSYFAGGRIVNLDGLVNDEVYPFIRENQLLEYLAARDIRIIADYGAMVGSRAARERGGYDTPATDACIKKVSKLKDGPRWYDSELNIYQVDAACVGSHRR